jgi:hypothetical protein
MWPSKAAVLTRMLPPRDLGRARARKINIIKGHARGPEKKIHCKFLNHLLSVSHLRIKYELLLKSRIRHNSGQSRARERPRVNCASMITEREMHISSRVTLLMSIIGPIMTGCNLNSQR